MSPLQKVFLAAQKAQLRFLVGGGYAVMSHGYARSTFDLDLVVPRDDRTKWEQLTASLGYVLHHSAENFVQFDANAAGLVPLDLMLVANSTFTKLDGDAVAGPGDLGYVKVVSLRHLLALKCHAIKHGHAGRIIKDADDVIRLCEVNRVNLDDPQIKEIFLKYGPADLYEKTRRIFQQQ